MDLEIGLGRALMQHDLSLGLNMAKAFFGNARDANSWTPDAMSMQTRADSLMDGKPPDVRRNLRPDQLPRTEVCRP